MAARNDQARSFGHWSGGTPRESSAAKAKREAREARERSGGSSGRSDATPSNDLRRDVREFTRDGDASGQSLSSSTEEMRDRLNVIARRRGTRDELRDNTDPEPEPAKPPRDPDPTRSTLMRMALKQRARQALRAADGQDEGSRHTQPGSQIVSIARSLVDEPGATQSDVTQSVAAQEAGGSSR